jgi:hypothetical protein
LVVYLTLNSKFPSAPACDLHNLVTPLSPKAFYNDEYTNMPFLPGAPVIIRLSDEERDSGVMSDHHVYDAVEAFFNDGFVVLENAVHDDKIDSLNERMLKDTERLMAGEGLSHFA